MSMVICSKIDGDISRLDNGTPVINNQGGVFFPLCKCSTNGQLLVWVGGLDIWNPLMKGIVT